VDEEELIEALDPDEFDEADAPFPALAVPLADEFVEVLPLTELWPPEVLELEFPAEEFDEFDAFEDEFPAEEFEPELFEEFEPELLEELFEELEEELVEEFEEELFEEFEEELFEEFEVSPVVGVHAAPKAA